MMIQISKVTLQIINSNAEHKIHSSGLSDPFFSYLPHVPVGKLFLWDFSLKG